jgi:cytochrome c oxidase assembly protein subunit 20
MAEDTRELEGSPVNNVTPPEVRRPRRPTPKHDFPKTQAGRLWDAFGNPEERVNAMPGGTFNSAGGKPKEVSWRDAFKFSELSKEGRPPFYQTSCARDSLLVGIGAGGAVGGLRFILKGTSP